MNNRNNIINTAVQFLGTPYVWGGTTPEGFDCSGFTQYVYAQNGITIPRTASQQYASGISVDKNNLQVGDLVFFNGYLGTGNTGHVGIYVGNGQYIHSPSSNDVVKISSLDSRSDYVGAKRYITDGITSLSDTTTVTSDSVDVSFWGAIVRILAILFLVVVAVVFFLKAFDISLI